MSGQRSGMYMCNGILLSHKKWSNTICSNMDGPRECHTVCGKSEIEK